MSENLFQKETSPSRNVTLNTVMDRSWSVRGSESPIAPISVYEFTRNSHRAIVDNRKRDVFADRSVYSFSRDACAEIHKTDGYAE